MNETDKNRKETNAQKPKRMVITEDGNRIERGLADTLYQKGILAKTWRKPNDSGRMNLSHAG